MCREIDLLVNSSCFYLFFFFSFFKTICLCNAVQLWLDCHWDNANSVKGKDVLYCVEQALRRETNP